ncbi:MAG TPA: response regulator [Polyangiaceae bacterium]|jgi:CheY-like chemotaxis protein|nr:response regulator [Polyangiaceae bacterium]
MSRGVVLIVDDDPIVLEVTRERLSDAGYTVFVREEALGTSQWTAEFHPDIILLDVNMPALTGIDLAQLLKKRAATKDVAIILYSSLEASELQAKVSATGAVGAIQKTSDATRFMEAFEHLVSRAGEVSRRGKAI